MWRDSGGFEKKNFVNSCEGLRHGKINIKTKARKINALMILGENILRSLVLKDPKFCNLWWMVKDSLELCEE